MIYSWAKKKDTHYVLDPVFQENFLNDFKKLLPDNYSNSLTSIKQMDLREYFVLVDTEEKEKEKIKSKTLEERKKILQEKKKKKKSSRIFMVYL